VLCTNESAVGDLPSRVSHGDSLQRSASGANPCDGWPACHRGCAWERRAHYSFAAAFARAAVRTGPILFALLVCLTCVCVYACVFVRARFCPPPLSPPLSHAHESRHVTRRGASAAALWCSASLAFSSRGRYRQATFPCLVSLCLCVCCEHGGQLCMEHADRFADGRAVSHV